MMPLDPVPEDALDPEVVALDRRLELTALSQGLDSHPRFPRELYRAMGEARLLGLSVPVEHGGRGYPPTRVGRVLYRLAYAGGTVTAKLALQPEFCSLLCEFGSPAQRRDSFLPLLKGERLVGNQITEPSAGSDLRGIATRVERRGSGFVLSGTKSQAAFAQDAEEAIVYARGPEEEAGFGAFLVPQRLPGVERSVVEDHGERWMRRGTVEYRAVELPRDAFLVGGREAREALRRELLRERVFLAAIYLGVARRSWEETVRYVGERRTFGAPLSERQAVSFPLVEDWVRLESAWRQTEAVLAALERGSASEAETALVKWYAGEVAITAVQHAMQFHGGRGYSKELPHEQRLRDLGSARLAHGSAEIAHVAAARALWPRPSGSGNSI